MRLIHIVAEMVLLCALEAYGTGGQTLDQVLDAHAAEDVFRQGAPTRGFSDQFGQVLENLNVDEVGLLRVMRDRCTNLCCSADVSTDRRSQIRLNCLLNLLWEYDRTNAVPVFAFCATNCVDGMLAGRAMRRYALLVPPAQVQAFAGDEPVQSKARKVREEIYRGMLGAAKELYLSHDELRPQLTAQVMGILAFNDVHWGQADEVVCRWWPDYATSSNRYVAAQRALQTVPPPASSNYLNRVIAELEALPPGTMRMLSTNHLGQAWQE